MNKKWKEIVAWVGAGGIATVFMLVVGLYVRYFVGSSPLCTADVSSGIPSLCTSGLIVAQLAVAVAIAALLHFFFRRYVRHAMLISFFALYFTWHLKAIVGWLYMPLQLLQGEWIFYLLTSLLGGIVFFLFYIYFTKLKIRLWVKILFAVLVLLILPFILLNIERYLYIAFHMK